jgi:hypothetical protein
MTVHAATPREGREENVANGNKPTLIAYSVKDARGSEPKAIWTRIGAAWAHESGPGYSIRLDALPVDGRIVLVAPAEAKPGERA